jgi:predicted phage terminase large subunit-like protein
MPIKPAALQGRKLSQKEKTLLRKAAKQQLCLDSLYEYLQEAWQYVEPGMPLHLNWHIKTIARELQVVYPGVRQEEAPFGYDVVAHTDADFGEVVEHYETRQEAEEAAEFCRQYGGEEGLPDLVEVEATGGVVQVQENWRAWVQEEYRPAPLWRNSRLIINIPPGHMKSLMVSVFWPSWIWLHDPGHRVLSISGSDSISIRDALRTRKIIDTTWYQSLVAQRYRNLERTAAEAVEATHRKHIKITQEGATESQTLDTTQEVRRGIMGAYGVGSGNRKDAPWCIDKKKDAKASFGTNLGGYRESKAIGSKITGERGYGWTLDDPIDVKDVLTHGQVDHQRVSERCKEVTNIVDRVLDSRVNDRRAGMYYNVIIMQRLHVDDPPGTFFLQGGWRFVVARSRYVPDEDLGPEDPPNHADDPRSKAGQVLFPRRFPEEVLQDIERRLEDQWEAQHQQNPLPGKGGMMSRALEACRRYIEDPFKIATGAAGLRTPDGDPVGRMELMMTVDATLGAKGVTASNVAIQVWGRPYKAAVRAHMYLLDCVADRMTYTETEQAIKDMKRRWPRIRIILIEKKVNGAALIERLSNMVNGIEPYDPDGSKTVRAGVLASCMRAGQVFLPAGDPRSRDTVQNPYTPWVADLITELVRFPGGRRDDRVDAASSAAIYWTEGEPPVGPEERARNARAGIAAAAGRIGLGDGSGWSLGGFL